MTFRILRTASAVALIIGSASAAAQQFDVTVTIENLAPTNGTNQTPHWVGFHDGVAFDIYDSGTPANSLPRDGSDALERLAEDGNNAPITAEFEALQSSGVQGTIAGPNGPIAPGDVGTMTFRLNADGTNDFFSYASMLLPSNDFFYANANPQAHRIFENGEFVAEDFIVGNGAVRDAGTEVNDELADTTAFFSQSVADTGTVETRVITTIQADAGLVRFAPGGRILSEPQFAMADFSLPNYPLVKISFTAEEVDLNPPPRVDVIPGPGRFLADLDQAQEIPAVDVETGATGRAFYFLNNRGDQMRFAHIYRNLENVILAHLHLGPVGDTGPVVVDLIAVSGVDLDILQGNRQAVARSLRGVITEDDLIGPLAGQSLGALTQAILDGQIYINIHTEQNPAGEIRGQLDGSVRSRR